MTGWPPPPGNLCYSHKNSTLSARYHHQLLPTLAILKTNALILIDERHFRTRFLPMTIKKRKAGTKVDETEVKAGAGGTGDDGTPDNDIEGVIGIVMDVTEVKAKEAVLEAQAKEKQQLLANEAAAKEASRLKSQFLANVSFDPLHIWAALGMLTTCRCLTKFGHLSPESWVSLPAVQTT